MYGHQLENPRFVNPREEKRVHDQSFAVQSSHIDISSTYFIDPALLKLYSLLCLNLEQKHSAGLDITNLELNLLAAERVQSQG